ncbi:MAG: orotate phosphoribosyltransferase [Bacteroidales bacterium]|nr:orotate phosphoribosyltransferase [Bacteroidales bacterium]
MESFERTVAKHLLDIKAVLLSPDEPFTWASGWKSPIYCDNRKILSYPKFRSDVADYMVELISDKFPSVEIIAGVATGAIAIGALVAERMDKPFIYIRPKPKDHGTGSQIEGELPHGANVVVIEDLISTGMSSLGAADAAIRAGANVIGMVAVFSYNFPKARKAFENANIELHTLSNYDTLIDCAIESGYVSESDLDVLRDWRFRPDVWTGKNS